MAVKSIPEPKDLKWSHYTGPVPGGSPLDAFTKPAFALTNTKAVKDGEKYRLEKVDITLTMEKLECWVRESKKTDALLEHERGHWYMQGLVAKEMETALAALRDDDPTALFKAATVKFDWHRKDRSGFVDKQYDDDTNHGTNKPQQEIWDGKIAAWVAKGVIDLAGPP
ncbi:MAG TPA: hypothetical protein VLJ18_10530 [Thermoanaerobaculia bacterium]|nr:hypothetical protein [Thermoanaerobaculia bacterium]